MLRDEESEESLSSSSIDTESMDNLIMGYDHGPSLEDENPDSMDVINIFSNILRYFLRLLNI